MRHYHKNIQKQPFLFEHGAKMHQTTVIKITTTHPPFFEILSGGINTNKLMQLKEIKGNK